MSPLVEQIEELVLPGQRRATVARFASRFFVLVGPRNGAPSARVVEGPYETQGEAAGRARVLQSIGFEGATS